MDEYNWWVNRWVFGWMRKWLERCLILTNAMMARWKKQKQNDHSLPGLQILLAHHGTISQRQLICRASRCLHGLGGEKWQEEEITLWLKLTFTMYLKRKRLAWWNLISLIYFRTFILLNQAYWILLSTQLISQLQIKRAFNGAAAWYFDIQN